YGIVPRDIYPGLNYGETAHKHGELVTALTGVVQTVVKNPNGKISPVWLKGVEGVLDAYLGEKPVSFSFNGKMFTPKEFAKDLGINPDDYVEFSSYTHHPFYQKFVLEVPDNWAQESMYNVPIDDLIEIIDYSLNKGISISWGADISNLGFTDGFGRIMSDGADFKNPEAGEKQISQNDRQYMFDSWQLTDDHAMHLTGIAQDQFGNKYYLEKNSWGEGGKFKGYSYLSVPFMRMRTMSIMLHKDGVPPQIANKIGLK
ncbi:MAG: aminopeptidase, partial [Bacteroidia bacterium]|nr:aminopeptidase [Bacteroidia bacterium]